MVPPCDVVPTLTHSSPTRLLKETDVRSSLVPRFMPRAISLRDSGRVSAASMSASDSRRTSSKLLPEAAELLLPEPEPLLPELESSESEAELPESSVPEALPELVPGEPVPVS